MCAPLQVLMQAGTEPPPQQSRDPERHSREFPVPPGRQRLLPAQALATAGLFYVPKVLPINGLMQCVLSAVWLSSQMHLRFAHVAACANNSSFLTAEW